MAIVDRIVKQLLIEGRRDVAAWLLGVEIDDAIVETVELPGDSLYADTVFQVQLTDGRKVIVHIEIQGRRSTQPMPQRMLSYMVRLAHRYNLPIQSTILYTEPNAGSQDIGQHTYTNLEGQPFLSWHYHVIHLWKLRTEDILNLEWRSLMPLVGLTKIEHPQQTTQVVLGKIREEPDARRQAQLLAQLMELVQDEEMSAMIEQALTKEDLEEAKQFPFLWRMLTDARNSQLRDNILQVLVTRFDPRVTEYQAIEQALGQIKETDHLRNLFQNSLQVTDMAAFTALLRPDDAA